MENITVEEMEDALRAFGFFVGGLTDEAIAFYYKRIFTL